MRALALALLLSTPALAAPVRVEESGLVYTGTWETMADSQFSGGAYRRSNVAGAAATLTFTGTAVSVYADQWGDLGAFWASVDGRPATMVSQNGSNTVGPILWWTWSGPAGSHTLRVEVVGGAWVDIDFIEYEPSVVVPPVDPQDPCPGGPFYPAEITEPCPVEKLTVPCACSECFAWEPVMSTPGPEFYEIALVLSLGTWQVVARVEVAPFASGCSDPSEGPVTCWPARDPIWCPAKGRTVQPFGTVETFAVRACRTAGTAVHCSREWSKTVPYAWAGYLEMYE